MIPTPGIAETGDLGGGGGGYLNMFVGTGTYMFEGIAKLLGFTDEIYVILRIWVKDMQKLFDDYFVL